MGAKRDAWQAFPLSDLGYRHWRNRQSRYALFLGATTAPIPVVA